MAFYGVGVTLAAAGTGSVLGMVGSWVTVEPSVRLKIIILVALILAVGDLMATRSMFSIGWPRQTDSRWRKQRGPAMASFLWGLDVGLGFTTVRVTVLFWVTLTIIIWSSSPLYGALVLSGYGLALVFDLFLGHRLILDRRHAPPSALRFSYPVRRYAAIAIAVWAAGLSILSLI